VTKPEPLLCAFCLYDPRGVEAQPAVTMIGGMAVCDDHLGYAHSDSLNVAISLMKSEAP